MKEHVFPCTNALYIGYFLNITDLYQGYIKRNHVMYLEIIIYMKFMFYLFIKSTVDKLL